MFDRSHTLDQVDAEVWAAVLKENERQEQHIELIASENYTSPAVMQAQGTQLTNKYAEGYPGKRYYGGCEYVDIVERAALARAKTADRTSVIVIDTDPMITTEAGGWWWDVAVPEVSDRPQVNAARRDYERRARMKRDLS